ncbi:KRAB domain-containing zinc finger protein [Clonorchis sinensis]|uniref:KRAB domain-containing zinc finger protein n=1 Tax=Clonorchis sinensis TaxID=79923 RepID=H2KR77_CLOSI|nr:KRAB domain-containing zinc finger protein [Clonorchis sinensis]
MLEPSGKHLRMRVIVVFMKEWYNCESSVAWKRGARKRQLTVTVNKLPTSEYGNFGSVTGLQHVKLIRNSLPTTEETDDKSRVYKCHLCGNSFAWSWKLRSHTLTHSGSRNYPCDLCDKLFKYEHTLNAHIRTVHMDEHSGDQLQKHTCEVCGKRCTYHQLDESFLNRNEGIIS